MQSGIVLPKIDIRRVGPIWSTQAYFIFKILFISSNAILSNIYLRVSQ